MAHAKSSAWRIPVKCMANSGGALGTAMSDRLWEGFLDFLLLLEYRVPGFGQSRDRSVGAQDYMPW